LLADPAPDHLIELRKIIYPTVKRSPPPSLADAQAAGYALQEERALRFTIALGSPAMIQDLVAMTPHAFRMPQAGRQALADLSALSVTVDVVVRLLRLGPT
jgi:23S rRNA (guanine745-N1)-methyltransferase